MDGHLTRRAMLGACAAPLVAALPAMAADEPAPAGEQVLRSTALARQFPGMPAPTPMWGFNDSTPGPLLRFRKGERVSILLQNGFQHPTTVHWHGVRVPIGMDGVPGVSQPPVKPGESFRYQFTARDSGTFWYHPHQKSFEQVGRGMYGAFIVEEERPVEVNGDVTWVLSDLLLDPATGAQAPYGRILEHATRGRIGNLVTLNGRAAGPEATLDVRSGDRVRLRLVNAATARPFQLVFEGHDPHVIAFDGQGVTPHRAGPTGVLLGPGMRVDLVIDCAGAPASRFQVLDTATRTVVGSLRYIDDTPRASNLWNAPLQLAPNDLRPPDLKNATRHEINIRGGNAGPPVFGMVDGRQIPLDEMMRQHGLAWTVNSHATHEEAHEHVPLFTFRRGTTHIITMQNGTAFIHPMHLHGHFFKVLEYNGRPPRFDEWRDTVFMDSWDEVTVAVVADEPGDWMFHCHVLEHAAAGMMGVIRVT